MAESSLQRERQGKKARPGVHQTWKSDRPGSQMLLQQAAGSSGIKGTA